MMSIWHLLWIVPASVYLGILLAAILRVGGDGHD